MSLRMVLMVAAGLVAGNGCVFIPVNYHAARLADKHQHRDPRRA